MYRNTVESFFHFGRVITWGQLMAPAPVSGLLLKTIELDVHLKCQPTKDLGKEKTAELNLLLKVQTTVRNHSKEVSSRCLSCHPKICGLQLEELLQMTEQLFMSCCWLCSQRTPVRPSANSAHQGYMELPQAQAEQWKITASPNSKCMRDSDAC